MEKIILESDNYNINLTVFEANNAKGCIQIIHGMEEHQERYYDFAQFLSDNGYTVITSNLRGHGSDAKKLGHIADNNGNTLLLNDQELITNYIKNKYNLPLFIFAHSFGTIILRNMLINHSNEYKAVIMSGYPLPNKLASLGILLTNKLIKKEGPSYYSNSIEKLSVGSFNKKIKKPHTEFDWLSKNDENVQKYISDPYCGHGFSVASFNTLFTLVKQMSNPKNYNNINKDLHILLLRGKEDPATGFDKGAKKSKQVLIKAGFNNISEISYENMRHEILNESNNHLVYNDILTYLNNF